MLYICTNSSSEFIQTQVIHRQQHFRHLVDQDEETPRGQHEHTPSGKRATPSASRIRRGSCDKRRSLGKLSKGDDASGSPCVPLSPRAGQKSAKVDYARLQELLTRDEL